MTVNDVLKETLRNKLAKAGGKPYNENYMAGQRYGSIIITQKGKQHWLVWELVDRGGKIIDGLKKEYSSFDDMWLELKRVLEIT
jgi:hypothetical protein